MEYARNAIRMSALMKRRSIFVYTHDSIGLGEDGPTHQPVEQLTALRATPNLYTWRPCDTVESATAWKHAIMRDDGPTALVFSRQSLEPAIRDNEQVALISKGGYVLLDHPDPKLLFIATGSEVNIAIQAARELKVAGISARVVSMPCAELFCLQDKDYRDRVLPPNLLNRIAVEALHKDYWYKFVGLSGIVVGMETFGESAPGDVLMQEFGFTKENLVNVAKGMLS
jgi:transketolase